MAAKAKKGVTGRSEKKTASKTKQNLERKRDPFAVQGWNREGRKTFPQRTTYG